MTGYKLFTAGNYSDLDKQVHDWLQYQCKDGVRKKDYNIVSQQLVYVQNIVGGLYVMSIFYTES